MAPLWRVQSFRYGGGVGSNVDIQQSIIGRQIIPCMPAREFCKYQREIANHSENQLQI